jgi:hypothetical protein
MGQTKVRCIKFENLFHLTIVALNQRDNFNFFNSGNTIKKIQIMMAPLHLTLSPAVLRFLL